MPPVPSHRPSPGHVPPPVVGWGFGVGVVPVVDLGTVLDETILPFIVEEAVIELLSELGAKGEVPTVETVAV